MSASGRKRSRMPSVEQYLSPAGVLVEHYGAQPLQRPFGEERVPHGLVF